MSEVEYNRLFDVEPGRVDVRVTVPWGEWYQRVYAEEGTLTTVQLPARIASPPLRALLGDRLEHPADGRTVVFVRPRREQARVQYGIDRSRSKRRDSPWTAVASVRRGRRRLAFPLSEIGAVAFDNVGPVRAEPLSTTHDPAWDSLVASGLLESLSNEESWRLATLKWNDVLIGVAASYALLAQERYDDLVEVIANLLSLDPRIVDVAIVAATRDRILERRDNSVRERLAAAAERMAVPLFGWGVPLAVNAARYYDLPEWAERCAGVDATLVRSSIWTLWDVAKEDGRN